MRKGMSCREAGILGSIIGSQKSAELKKERINKYLENPKLCNFCKFVINYDKRYNDFCSQTCSAKFNNNKRKKKTDHGTCCFCGKIKKYFTLKYCSHKCQFDFLYNQNITKWLNGIETGYSKDGNNSIKSFVRKWLYENRKEMCEKCNWKEKNPHSNKIPLQIHHIDGDSKNNNPNNLEILCPNCHSLTSTFGSLNKGNGRKKRKR